MAGETMTVSLGSPNVFYFKATHLQFIMTRSTVWWRGFGMMLCHFLVALLGKITSSL